MTNSPSPAREISPICLKLRVVSAWLFVPMVVFFMYQFVVSLQLLHEYENKGNKAVESADILAELSRFNLTDTCVNRSRLEDFVKRPFEEELAQQLQEAQYTRPFKTPTGITLMLLGLVLGPMPLLIMGAALTLVVLVLWRAAQSALSWSKTCCSAAPDIPEPADWSIVNTLWWNKPFELMSQERSSDYDCIIWSGFLYTLLGTLVLEGTAPAVFGTRSGFAAGADLSAMYLFYKALDTNSIRANVASIVFWDRLMQFAKVFVCIYVLFSLLWVIVITPFPELDEAKRELNTEEAEELRKHAQLWPLLFGLAAAFVASWVATAKYSFYADNVAPMLRHRAWMVVIAYLFLALDLGLTSGTLNYIHNGVTSGLVVAPFLMESWYYVRSSYETVHDSRANQGLSTVKQYLYHSMVLFFLFSPGVHYLGLYGIQYRWDAEKNSAKAHHDHNAFCLAEKSLQDAEDAFAASELWIPAIFAAAELLLRLVVERCNGWSLKKPGSPTLTQVVSVFDYLVKVILFIKTGTHNPAVDVLMTFLSYGAAALSKRVVSRHVRDQVFSTNQEDDSYGQPYVALTDVRTV